MTQRCLQVKFKRATLENSPAKKNNPHTQCNVKRSPSHVERGLSIRTRPFKGLYHKPSEVNVFGSSQLSCRTFSRPSWRVACADSSLDSPPPPLLPATPRPPPRQSHLPLRPRLLPLDSHRLPPGCHLRRVSPNIVKCILQSISNAYV